MQRLPLPGHRHLHARYKRHAIPPGRPGRGGYSRYRVMVGQRQRAHTGRGGPMYQILRIERPVRSRRMTMQIMEEFHRGIVTQTGFPMSPAAAPIGGPSHK